MWNALSIPASGLAASAAQFTKAASRVASAFTGGSAPQIPPSQPASSLPTAAPAANPLSGATAVAAQQAGDPSSWMVEILKAKAAYAANAASFKAAEDMTRKTIEALG